MGKKNLPAEETDSEGFRRPETRADFVARFFKNSPRGLFHLRALPPPALTLVEIVRAMSEGKACLGAVGPKGNDPKFAFNRQCEAVRRLVQYLEKRAAEVYANGFPGAGLGQDEGERLGRGSAAAQALEISAGVVRMALDEKADELFDARNAGGLCILCEFIAAHALVAGILAAELGLQPHMDDLWRGKGVLESARRGHKNQYGDDAEKEARWTRHQAVVDRIRAAHPDISSAELWRKAERQLKADGEGFCKARTIRKHCKDPASPHPRRKN